MKKWHPPLIAVTALATVAPADEPSPRQLVANANQAFAEGNFEAALEGYNKADVYIPESPEVSYNQALAHYKLGDYVAARNHFNRALATRDLEFESDVKYNLGNVAYASALEKLSSPQEAIDLLKRGIGHYRDALELDPDDQDAKANIQAAQLLIKDLLDKLKQQQEQQQQQQQQGDQNNQDQQQHDQQEQEQQQQQGQQGDQQQQDPSQGQQQQQEQQQQEGGQRDAQQRESDQQQQQVEAREMTQEEAERLLQAVRDKEKRRREDRARRMQARRSPVVKDW
jgi:Ca-activated chloride channel family protein